MVSDKNEAGPKKIGDKLSISMNDIQCFCLFYKRIEMATNVPIVSQQQTAKNIIVYMRIRNENNCEFPHRIDILDFSLIRNNFILHLGCKITKNFAFIWFYFQKTLNLQKIWNETKILAIFYFMCGISLHCYLNI